MQSLPDLASLIGGNMISDNDNKLDIDINNDINNEEEELDIPVQTPSSKPSSNITLDPSLLQTIAQKVNHDESKEDNEVLDQITSKPVKKAEKTAKKSEKAEKTAKSNRPDADYHYQDSYRIDEKFIPTKFSDHFMYLLKEINKYKDSLPDCPSSITETKALGRNEYKSGKIKSVNFETSFMTVEYEITYDKDGEDKVVSKKAAYGKVPKSSEGKTPKKEVKLQPFETTFHNLSNVYFQVMKEVKKLMINTEKGTKKFGFDIFEKDLINSHLVYDINEMKIKSDGPIIYDSSLGLVYSDKFELGYCIEDSDAYKYRQRDYSCLFNTLRTNSKWNLTKNKQCCYDIFKLRSAIVYHPKFKESVADNWKKAQENIDKKESDSKIVQNWKNIMHSETCFNVICKGYPASTMFLKQLKNIISDRESCLLLLNELYPIAPIFSPYGIYLEGITIDPKMLKAKASWNKRFVEFATYVSNDILNYESCYWIKGLEHAIDRDQESDQRSGRSLLTKKVLEVKVPKTPKK